LSSFKAPEPAVMHKETQKSFLSHIHTHTHTHEHRCQSAASHWRHCAFVCLPEHVNLARFWGASVEDLWELPGDHRRTFQNEQFVSV